MTPIYLTGSVRGIIDGLAIGGVIVGFVALSAALGQKDSLQDMCEELSRQPLYQHQPFPLDCENL